MALCRAAAAAGTTTIVATPHVLRDGWVNDSPLVRDGLIAKLNDLLGGTPAVLPGCEYFFADDALAVLELGSEGPLTPLNRSRYLLVEFPPGFVHPGAEGIFHEMVVAGTVPVIAHPERNLVLARDPERMSRLLATGALAQVTAGSLAGDFGRAARRTAWGMLEEGLVALVASDAHGLKTRGPRMLEARRLVAAELGEAEAARLFDVNPERVLKSEELG